MRVFNRIVMVIGILASLAATLLLAFYPINVARLMQAYAARFEADFYATRFQILFIIGVAVWVALLLFLLVLELRRGRRKTVRIRTESAAKAVLGVDSVAQSLEFRIDELAGVRQVTPHVRSRGKDVEIIVDLDTSPSVNIPILTDQVVTLCRDIAEGQLGVKIHGKVGINVRHEPYPRGTMPPMQPLPKGAEVSAPQPLLAEPAMAAATVVESKPAPQARPAARPTPQARPAPESKPVAAAPAPAPEVRPVVAPAPEPEIRPVAAPAPEVKPAAESQAVSESRLAAEAKEPWFKRRRPAPPPPAPEPEVEPEPIPTPESEDAAAAQQGPAPLGDLTPLAELADARQAAADVTAEEDEFDDLDYDPTERDE